MEPLMCCYVYAHTEKNSKWSLLHTRDTGCRGGVAKPVFHHVKPVNRLKCNTTSHGALHTIAEGHTIEGWCDVHFIFEHQKTIRLPETTFPGLNPPSRSHSG